MVNYRRNLLAGATYFFTATLKDRQSTCLTTYVDALRQAFIGAQKAKPFRIDAITVLPEHLHTVWTLPEDDSDYPGRWRTIKGRFTRSLIKQGIAIPRNEKGEYELWQRRYWEHTIRDESDLQRHVDYTHYNPVKHGFVKHVADWPFSSFHRYVRDGLLPADWAGVDSESGKFGE
ncbi:transposase [Herbaspirillum sp. HC18]|nr:transposase [Herbaspirillum sp. HC18]